MERTRFYDESLGNRIALSERQIDFLRGAVRASYRKQMKGAAILQRKFGDDYDPEHVEERLAFIREVYVALGGDPLRIDEPPKSRDLADE